MNETGARPVVWLMRPRTAALLTVIAFSKAPQERSDSWNATWGQAHSSPPKPTNVRATELRDRNRAKLARKSHRAEVMGESGEVAGDFRARSALDRIARCRMAAVAGREGKRGARLTRVLPG